MSEEEKKESEQEQLPEQEAASEKEIKNPAPAEEGSDIDVYTSQEEDAKEDEAALDKIGELIEKKDIAGLKAFVLDKDPIDIAYILNDLNDDQQLVYFFKVIPSDFSAQVFSYLNQDEQEEIVRAFSNRDVQKFISEMPNDDLADFVEELPSNLVSKVLQQTSPDDRKAINALLNYKEDTAGSIMTTEYVSIKQGLDAQSALAQIRKVGKEAETIVTTFVIDSSRKLIGALSLEDLVFAESDTKVDSIMDDSCISVIADTDQEEVASVMKKYDLSVIPVVDKEQRMLGIVTVDDIMDVMEDEQTEDIAHMAGVVPTEADDYLKTSPFKLARSRIPWLVFLLLCDTLSCFILNSFEAHLAVIPVLTSFVPMLTDLGGNAGGQTTTVVTRALSLDQISVKDFFKVVWKEMRTAFIVAVIVAVVNFGWMMIELSTGIITNNPSPDGTHFANWQIAAVVALTGLIVVILSKSIGSMLPLLGKMIHVDPAIMAGPLVTSIVDSLSLAIYMLISLSILAH